MAVDEFGREVPASGNGRDSEYQEHSRGDRHSSRQRPSSPPPGQRSPERRKLRHPSLQYVEDPLLCEYLWTQKQKEKEGKEGSSDDAKEEEGSNETYEEYRKKYCLNYIRAFFNNHLDDIWFRSRYSPAGRQRFAELECSRSVDESRAIWKQINESEEAIASFIGGARLGGGQKDSSGSEKAPVSHLFSWQRPGNPTSALVVSVIPAVVTDEQLVIALLNHCSLPPPDPKQPNRNKPNLDLTVYGSTVIPTSGRYVLQRQAIVVGETPVIQDIWKALSKAQSSSSTRNEQVPRKEDDEEDRPVDLEVDCTDPYGRLEYDVDGRGGAPSDGLAVPVKKSSVQVKRLKNSTPTTVLSAALSSSSRLGSDQVAAQELAHALDEQIQIPSETGITSILLHLFGGKGEGEDVLDVCVAYLRRVHLVSFYNGCDQPASAVADVLTGKLPASSIRLRLQKADDILEPENEGDQAADSEPAKDMLVQMLDTSIERANKKVEDYMELLSSGDKTEKVACKLCLPTTIVSKAKEIDEAEERIRDKWVRDHTMIDDDNRARCSFHFCHKLFKDTSFLQKHLLKKHVEYLTAEQAKCHDEYMMEAWDEAGERPVPDILVDCGNHFGHVSTSLNGQVPDCVDPEPELWRREQERQEKVKEMKGMRSRRDDVRQSNYSHSPRDFSSNGPSAAQKRPSNFVDVDDMQVEKVEISFDSVEVAPVSQKKKKKKRKLL